MLRTIAKGMGIEFVEIPYRRCVIPLQEDLETIGRHVHETQSEVVIVDSLTYSCVMGTLNS